MTRTFDEFLADTKAHLPRMREFAKLKKAYEDKWEHADSMTWVPTESQKVEFDAVLRELDQIVEGM